ncbi:secreted protein [Melampsora americana]|nr:secreted protein [Melampsora americana]
MSIRLILIEVFFLSFLFSGLMAGMINPRNSNHGLVTVNDEAPKNSISNSTDSPYISYLSPANPIDQKYPNGTSKATTSYAPKFDSSRTSPDELEASTYFYPPPPPIGVPALRAMPYPLPKTDTQRHCPTRNDRDGLTVTLPSELYLERFTKCGQKIVIEFEDVDIGQDSNPIPKKNLTVTLIDAFDSPKRTEVGRTMMLSEKAWKEITGNSVINKFQTWPVKYFFIVSERDDKGQVNENGETETDGNSTRVYDSNNSTST